MSGAGAEKIFNVPVDFCGGLSIVRSLEPLR
jgi:hypothetical protein